MNRISITIYLHIQELDKEIKTIIIPDEGFLFLAENISAINDKLT